MKTQESKPVYAFENWFKWPLKVDGKTYSTDPQLKSMLAEIWVFESERKFYRSWEEGIKCGRIYEVNP